MSHSPIIGIIPARLSSTRLPGKVLLDRTGKPLVQHVYEAATRAAVLSRLVVATDDQRVFDAVRAFGGEALMTSPDHRSGTSRLAEAATALALPAGAIIVNVQGDEPEIEPGPIEAAVAALVTSGCPMATVASPFMPGESPHDPSLVKVVVRPDGAALYFSRSLIPFAREGGSPVEPLRHVGLYVYRREFLDVYCRLAPTPLEGAEVLEQLRVLEHGHAISVAIHPCRTAGIDTPEQYEAFVRRVTASR